MHRNAEYYLTHRELERLIKAATTRRDHALITLFVDTGLRRFEAGQLIVEDVRPDESILIVRNGKGGKLRLVPISDRLLTALHVLMNGDPARPLFRNLTGTAISTRQINRIVADAGRRADIRNPNPKHRNITCHLLRHSFARHWKDVGGNIETLARILGHASVKTTWDMYGTQSVLDVQRTYKSVITKIHPNASRKNPIKEV